MMFFAGYITRKKRKISLILVIHPWWWSSSSCSLQERIFYFSGCPVAKKWETFFTRFCFWKNVCKSQDKRFSWQEHFLVCVHTWFKEVFQVVSIPLSFMHTLLLTHTYYRLLLLCLKKLSNKQFQASWINWPTWEHQRRSHNTMDSLTYNFLSCLSTLMVRRAVWIMKQKSDQPGMKDDEELKESMKEKNYEAGEEKLLMMKP